MSRACGGGGWWRAAAHGGVVQVPGNPDPDPDPGPDSNHNPNPDPRISFAEAGGDAGRETLSINHAGHRASAGNSMSAPLLDGSMSNNNGGGDVVTRGSGGDSDFSRIDVLVTELVNNHGGWLSKRTRPGFNGQQGWKKRWVGIYDGVLFYSKTQAKTNQMSETDAKSVKLSGFTLMAGSDGLTIRMFDDDDKTRTVDWKAGTNEDREVP